MQSTMSNIRRINSIKIIFLIIIFCNTLLFSGCEVYYKQSDKPTNIYKQYIDTNYSTDVINTANSVVSIISSANVQTLGGVKTRAVSIRSGILIGEDYVLTCGGAVNVEIERDGTNYYGTASTFYAVLPDIYADAKHYKIEMINYDKRAGLALFRFYDDFYYYPKNNSHRMDAVKGFQFPIQFSDYPVEIGEDCYSIGNSLGNALNSEVMNAGNVSGLQISVNHGNISAVDYINKIYFNGSEFNYLLTTAVANVDAWGGALISNDGLLIGMPISKVYLNDDGEFLERLSICYPTNFLRAYLLSLNINLFDEACLCA